MNTLPSILLPVFLRYVGLNVAPIILFVILAWRKERWIHALGIALIFAAVVPNLVVWNIR